VQEELPLVGIPRGSKTVTLGGEKERTSYRKGKRRRRRKKENCGMNKSKLRGR
jgi:hypothetical protein